MGESILLNIDRNQYIEKEIYIPRVQTNVCEFQRNLWKDNFSFYTDYYFCHFY